MALRSAAELAEELDVVDVGSLGAADVVMHLHRVRRLEGWLSSVKADLATRADELHDDGEGAPAAEMLSRTTKTSSRDARLIERRSRLLARAPELAALLRAGRISSAHVDALANAVARLDDDQLTVMLEREHELSELAPTISPEAFARRCRALTHELMDRDRSPDDADDGRSLNTISRTIDPRTGRHRVTIDWDPETGHRAFTIIDHEIAALVAARRHDGADDTPLDRHHLGAVAVANLLAGGHSSRRPGKVEMTVIIDGDSLRGRLDEHGVCELGDGTPISVGAARRLACDADILPVVLGGRSVPLDHGRSRRLASPQQRKALEAIYATCAFDNCDIPFADCDIHHILEWLEHQGPTDLRYLVPQCGRHHHMVHEGGWRLDLAADRTLTITRPDGTVHAVCHPDRLPLAHAA
ncbi:DUF222 domain-containing protein [Ilumatobacter sp.]|uniref:HNH endonuclease signature motif containing protein n=1 Tax=Ilumatobacter sp. TaxID=1967498 RepID=UPI003AF525B9